MNQKLPFQYEKEFEVLSFQIDPFGKLRWSSLGDLMQEVAWKHADSRGFGQELFEKGLMWVLSRFQIQVHRKPSWGELITVKTAGRGISGLFALREFEVIDQAGEVLAEAMSAWLLLDVKSKRPKRPSQVLPSELFALTEDDSQLPPKITFSETGDLSTAFNVRASDLDMNNHVNNVSYIRWVEDFAIEQKKKFNKLCINYLSEARIGETVTIKGDFGDTKNILAGISKSKVFFIVEIA
ncbi:Acyl-ACP thioesterase [Indibacter alkaliphilus LW1]|uniref:Acyl-ACP thioesterase n=1 Tax=Indibacter alkaliphilus (strain CCUG 57479 / KCTC 22604 / LW1) TaxID=1189612 RepID=S2DTX3_INDAL|nr:acyl-ACP thioesterase domain-containing protein [Indibacter alkaliphilus]EOZ93283.1 Acyl-ACP thioesterase [Indibacter alkaliphilus LW1]